MTWTTTNILKSELQFWAAVNTTNAIFKHLGQNFLCDNKDDLGIWKINSWALSRLYNTKLRQIQKKKKKLVHIFTVKEHSVHSEQHSFKEKGTEMTKTSASVYEVQALQWLDVEAEV